MPKQGLIDWVREAFEALRESYLNKIEECQINDDEPTAEELREELEEMEKAEVTMLGKIQ